MTALVAGTQVRQAHSIMTWLWLHMASCDVNSGDILWERSKSKEY